MCGAGAVSAVAVPAPFGAPRTRRKCPRRCQLAAMADRASAGVAHRLRYRSMPRDHVIKRGRLSPTHHGASRAGRIVMSLISYLRTLTHQDEGQDLLEYALLVSLIAIAAIIAVTSAGSSVQTVFTDIAAKILPAT
jgi:Flp pilus assembly pilin Flp